jgi:trehalose-phosphatase
MPNQTMLQPLAEVISAVREQMGAVGRVALFLDFDGTLVPIQPEPATPRLDPDTAETLKSIARQDGLATTIISGRSVEDLYQRIRLENLIYAGNHGLEIFGRNLCFVEPAAFARRAQLESLCEELAAELRTITGPIVEYKGLTASVHYRLAAETDLGEIQKAVYAAVARNGKLFRVSTGRKVFEILPRTDWHKGAAVRWINQHLGQEDALVIYLGDDTSDEDAFSVLPEAITIRVGAVPVTCARYQLPDPAAVYEFLLWLASQEQTRPRGV